MIMMINVMVCRRMAVTISTFIIHPCDSWVAFKKRFQCTDVVYEPRLVSQIPEDTKVFFT